MQSEDESIKPSQRIRISEIIEGHSLNVGDFIKDEAPMKLKLSLKQDSRIYFIFKRSPDSFDSFTYTYTRCSPKRDQVSHNSKVYLTFDDTLKEFRTWVKGEVVNFLIEQKLNDPWEEFKNNYYDLLPQPGNNNNNTKLTQHEVVQFRETLEFFKREVIKELALSKEASLLLDKKIDKLNTDAEVKTRGDLKLQLFLFFGAIAYDLLLEPEKVFRLQEIFINILKSVKPFLA